MDPQAIALQHPLPFTVEQFYAVFVQYNDAVWPMQIALYAVGLAVLALLFARRPTYDRIISGLLTLLWAWMAVVYYMLFFTRMNGSGWLIGALLLAGGLWLGWVGGVQGRIRFAPRADARGAVGGLIVFYALVAYPLLGLAIGHRYPAMPTFGLPCPVTIFTVGMLMLATSPVPRSVFVVPAVWGLFGGTSATFLLGVHQDAGLLVAGLISLAFLVARPPSGQNLALGSPADGPVMAKRIAASR